MTDQTGNQLERQGYGSSEHYLGMAGERYFEQYRVAADLDARLNWKKFSRFISPQDSVLDFGCASGDLLMLVPSESRVGIEINPAPLREARAKGLECYATISEIIDRQFDVILSNHTLEHVPHPLEALRQLRRVLKPGGSLLLCVPLDDWRNEKKFDPQDINHHLFTWTPLAMGHLLSEAGFKVSPEDIVILDVAWPPKYPKLYRLLPDRLFDLGTRLWSKLRRRRQIFAAVEA